MKLISVVLPVYNGADYLRESIDSVRMQTYQNFELIVVDDCSTDNTPEIVQEYLQKDTRIQYYRNSDNLKLPATLNVGFNKAKGDFWTWTSCDNIYKPEALEAMQCVLHDDPATDLVYASMDITDPTGKLKHTIEAKSSSELIYENVVGACFLYRASLAKKAGEYDESLFLCEDYEFWLRCALIGKFTRIKESLYLYRQHEKSLSSERTAEIIKKGIMIQRRYCTKFIKTNYEYAKLYNSIRERDMLNPWRHLYFMHILFYSPVFFMQQAFKIISSKMERAV